jgi:hypothetical protein
MLKRAATLFMAVVMTLGLTAPKGTASQVVNWYSNIHLTNLTGQAVDGFELTVRADGLTCGNFIGWYPHWGTVGTWGNAVPSGGCQNLGGGRVKIIWSDPAHLIAPNQKVHFGAQFATNTPGGKVVEAVWTYQGARVALAPVTWSTTIPTDSCPIAHVIWPPDSTPVYLEVAPPWVIAQAWAWTPVILPLDSLVYTNPAVQALGWSAIFQDTLGGLPYDSLVLWTDPLPQEGAVIFQYFVLSEARETLAVFTNEGALELSIIPTLTEWGMIIFGVLLFGWMAWMIVRRRRRVTIGI